jgi:hypothetical protein
MARGYWGPSCWSCRCCHSGPKEKFWCQPCDHVCKAPTGHAPHCPYCQQKMTNMGHRWRPGRKGKRTATGRTYALRHPPLLPWEPYSREAEALRLLKRWGG